MTSPRTRCVQATAGRPHSRSSRAKNQGRSRGGQRGHLPPLFSRKTRVLNELLPQIVALVVLTLGKYHTKAGNKAVLIADPTRARRGMGLLARVLRVRFSNSGRGFRSKNFSRALRALLC